MNRALTFAFGAALAPARCGVLGLDGELDGVKFELLIIMAEPVDTGGFKVTLLVAGDVALRLQVDELALALEDFGEPSLASATPKHDLSTPTTAGS